MVKERVQEYLGIRVPDDLVSNRVEAIKYAVGFLMGSLPYDDWRKAHRDFPEEALEVIKEIR